MEEWQALWLYLHLGLKHIYIEIKWHGFLVMIRLMDLTTEGEIDLALIDFKTIMFS